MSLIPKSLRRGKKPPQGTNGKRVYAIGDVHGRLDVLDELLDQINSHAQTASRVETHLIFLGDLIDRGPQSRGVVERVMDPISGIDKVHFILGNHEEALVRGLSGEPNLLKSWLTHGGYDTAESYGVERGLLIEKPDDVLEHLLSSAIPPAHLKFMGGFLDSIRFGDYLFVHAGVRPGIPLTRQWPQDLRWIRDEFLDSDADFGAVVVHGHTIAEAITEKSNRIGLDTGAYSTGKLSAVWIEGKDRGYLQVSGPPDPSFDLGQG
ncbi:MAG: metallophosphoesterase family protein [Henriciella sp.]|nr:metallophosphoesterase family protein [Henriciella sp.]